MSLDCIFIEFLVIFGINLFLSITAVLSIIKDDRQAVKGAGQSDSNLARAAALRISVTKHWLVRIFKIYISCYKRLYRLDLNKQLWRAFWVNQQRIWKLKSWIISWICHYEPWNWFRIGAQWPIKPHEFLAYARCFHCPLIRTSLNSSSSAA